jgi:hypothetical protein
VRLALVLGVLLLAGVLPGVASAHVGRTLPVATNFLARITAPVPQVETKVVDGDKTLWLRASATTTVSIPGTLGEPLLRFDRRGVWLNLRSPTAQVDRIDRLDLRPSAIGRPPLWHRLASGDAYAWHEHRLHILEPLARGRSTAGSVGQWSVPVVVGGRRHLLEGVLDYRPPGPTWAWIALSAALAAASAVAAARSTALLVALALVATAATWTIRIGRELYGRPSVTVVGDVEIALTCAIGAALVYGLVHRGGGVQVLAAFLVGFGALYEGLTMFPVLTHAIALSALPTSLARTCEILVLGAGIGTLLGSVFGHLNLAERESADAVV